MEINSQPYLEDKTDTIINLLNTILFNDALITEYMKASDGIYAASHMLSLSPKKIFQTVFGKQLTTKDYSHRSWIWTFEKQDAIVYTLINVTGISFECHRDSDPETAISIMSEIKNQCLAYAKKELGDV